MPSLEIGGDYKQMKVKYMWPQSQSNSAAELYNFGRGRCMTRWFRACCTKLENVMVRLKMSRCISTVIKSIEFLLVCFQASLAQLLFPWFPHPAHSTSFGGTYMPPNSRLYLSNTEHILTITSHDLGSLPFLTWPKRDQDYLTFFHAVSPWNL